MSRLKMQEINERCLLGELEGLTYLLFLIWWSISRNNSIDEANEIEEQYLTKYQGGFTLWKPTDKNVMRKYELVNLLSDPNSENPESTYSFKDERNYRTLIDKTLDNFCLIIREEVTEQ